MRRAIAIAVLAPFLVAAVSCGDDDGGDGADAGDECQAYCEAYYADDLEGCDVCGVEVVFEDGVCVSCEWDSCVPDLCVAWCQENGDADGGTCSITCVCD